MKIKKFFITLFSVFSVSTGHALTLPSDCLSQEDIAALKADFSFKDLGDPRPSATVNFDICNPSSLTYVVAEAMIFLKNLPPLVQTQDDFNFNVIGKSPYEFLKNRTEIIVFENPQAGSHGPCTAEGTLAYAEFGKGQNIMHVCPAVAEWPKLIRSAMLVHEARHFDGKEYDHGFCQTGPLGGQFACDYSYEHGGSYGVETEYYVRLSRTPEVATDIRDKAREYAVENFVYRFIKRPLDIRDGAMLVAENSNIYFYDGTNETPMLERNNPSEIVSLRSNSPVFFNPESGIVESLAGTSNLVPTDGPTAALFRSFTDEKRKSVLDVYYGDYACFLFARSLFCKNGADIAEIDLPQEAKKFVTIGNLPGDNELVMILFKNGDVVQLPFERPIISKWSYDEFIPVDNLKNYLGLANLPGMNRIAILPGGEFAKFSKTTNKYEPDPALAGRRYKKIVSPFSWSARFSEL